MSGTVNQIGSRSKIVDGDIGIGTATPKALIHARGVAAEPNTTDPQEVGNLRIEGSNTNSGITMGSHTSAPWNNWIQSIQSNGVVAHLSLQPVGGKVGIGTTNPSDIKMLEIQDPTTRNVATIGDAPGMKLTSRLDTVGERLEINFESYTSQTYGTASIGIVHDSTSAYETSALFFATKSGTGGSDRPIERLRITSSGNVGFGTATPSGIGHFYLAPQCWVYIQGTGTGNDHSGINILTDSGTWTWGAAHSGSSAIGSNLLYAYWAGKKLTLDTSGNLAVDGANTLSTFDFAEYFEWLDGNSDEENRTGISVVLEGDKIKPAEEGDTPIGIISATAAFIGNAAPMRWHGKYKCNDLGEFTLDTDGERVVSDDYVENILKGTEEDVHPTVIYENRESRQEWDVVGLLGQIALKKGQPVADSWIKMKDVSETVELWFVK